MGKYVIIVSISLIFKQHQTQADHEICWVKCLAARNYGSCY